MYVHQMMTLEEKRQFYLDSAQRASAERVGKMKKKEERMKQTEMRWASATKLHALQKKHPLLKEDKDSYVASQAAIHEVKRQIMPPSRPSTSMSARASRSGLAGCRAFACGFVVA